jgi:rRNA processing protein Gar1
MIPVKEPYITVKLEKLSMKSENKSDINIHPKVAKNAPGAAFLTDIFSSGIMQ